MAPFNYHDSLLLDSATRAQAEVAGLDAHIADSQALARQRGGRRSRKQRGGSHLANFNASYELLSANVPRGVNPQFHTEGSVNHLYHAARGAQGY